MSLVKNHYMQDSGDSLYRRSLYNIWRRVVAPATFFDVPSRQSCIVKPQRTSTPLYSLTTLNDPAYVEAAKVWAIELSSLPDDDHRIERIFSATARRPTVEECEVIRVALDEARVHCVEEASVVEVILV